ncbi:30S ribosomal protein S7 [Candidatus Pacearchaeota archaeon]|nr:30S ribosomal protein S7 [Candidatus Pacearchaeota archaeon]
MLMKIFNIYDISMVKVDDPGLKRYINLDAKLILKSHGRARERFSKAKVNIVERLANLVAVPGHRGKKHKIIKSDASGKYSRNVKVVLEAFKILEKNGNPVQIFVKGIENSSPRDEVTVIEYGGARYPQAVDISPSRRLSLALRNIVHGASDKAFNKKKRMSEALASEILLASQNSPESFAVQKRYETEKQADAAR